MRLNPLRPGTSLTAALRSLTLSSSSSIPPKATTTPAPSSSSSSSSSASQQSRRAFSTTPARHTKTIQLHNIPSDAVPPYPYGPRLLYKQSNTGLYGSARIRHGHNVSEKYHQVSPRTWRPNVHRKRLWSECLGAWVRARLTTRVLRTVRREGGIDAYVTKNKAARVRELGPGGWNLRWLVMQTAAFRDRRVAERAELGVAVAVDGAAGGNRSGGVVRDVDNTDLVHVVVDAATHGPLGATSRSLLEKRANLLIAQEFALGEEAEAEFLAGSAGEDVSEEEEVHLEGQNAPSSASAVTKKKK